MAKSYSEKFLIGMHDLNEKRIGVQFGKLCVKANLPPSVVANAMGVSRMSVYNWFRGKAVRENNLSMIEKFMDIIESSLEGGALPVPNTFEAWHFVKNNVLNKI